jgi:hypothetical protein
MPTSAPPGGWGFASTSRRRREQAGDTQEVVGGAVGVAASLALADADRVLKEACARGLDVGPLAERTAVRQATAEKYLRIVPHVVPPLQARKRRVVRHVEVPDHLRRLFALESACSSGTCTPWHVSPRSFPTERTI